MAFEFHIKFNYDSQPIAVAYAQVEDLDARHPMINATTYVLSFDQTLSIRPAIPDEGIPVGSAYLLPRPAQEGFASGHALYLIPHIEEADSLIVRGERECIHSPKRQILAQDGKGKGRIVADIAGRRTTIDYLVYTQFHKNQGGIKNGR